MTESHIRFFSRHFLALVGTYVIPKESEREEFANVGVPPHAKRLHFSYSAVPVVFVNDWYILTAGHAILPYITAIQNRQIFSTGVSVVDSLGTAGPATPGFPYEIKDFYEYAIDDPDVGLDYALLRLTKNHVDLISTNDVIPLQLDSQPSDWNSPNTSHTALGLPTEKTDLLDVNPGRVNDIYLQPWSIPIRRIKDDNCVFPRFVGEIVNLDDLCSIVGISGGPIFCFSDDWKTYSIAAIQSRWNASSKVVYATQVTSIVEHEIQRTVESLDEAQQPKNH